jgi:hypothetical protein
MPRLDPTYEIIMAMRKAQLDYCSKHNLESAFWCVDITIYQMDANMDTPLRKVIDYDYGYNTPFRNQGGNNVR